MDFCHIYQEMFAALQQGGLERVAEAAYRIMDMPVMIADTSYVVTAMYPEEKTGDRQWDSSRMGEPILVEAIIAYQYDGHWNAIREAQGAVYIDWGYCKEHPKYATLVEKEDKVLGSLAFLIGDRPRGDWHLDAVRIIAQAAGIAMDSRDSRMRKLVDLKEVMMQSLFLNNINSMEQFQRMAELAGFKTGPEYVLIGFLSGETQNKLFSDFIARRLMDLFPGSLLIHQQGCFYVLTDGRQIPQKEEVICRMTTRLKEAQALRAAFSNVFSDPMQLPLYREQVDSLLGLPESFRAGRTALHYRENALYIAMEALARNISEENLLHPVIRQLEAYDQAYNTEYLVTLKTYIHACYSKSGTSEALNIHRNTLAYRMEKIGEITGVNLRDPMTALHLLISFYYLDR